MSGDSRPDRASIERALVEFINTEIMASGHAVTPEDAFADAGVDSMALLKVLLFIETTYGFWIPDTDLTDDVIRDARSLATFVEARLATDV